MPDVKLEVLPPQYLPKTDCPHYSKGYCGYVSSLVGRVTMATGVRCEAWCKGDPETNGQAVADKVLAKEYPADFIGKTWAKWGRGTVELYPPSAWPAIAEALSELIAKPYVAGVYLTGSLLKPQPIYKDYDIAVLVRDPVAFGAEAMGNETLLPAYIGDVKTDYHFWTKLNPFFPAYDLAEGKLRMPLYSYAKFTTSLPIESPDLSVWTPEQRQQLEGIAARAAESAVNKLAADAGAKAFTDMPTPPQPRLPQRGTSRATSGKDCGCSRGAKTRQA